MSYPGARQFRKTPASVFKERQLEFKAKKNAERQAKIDAKMQSERKTQTHEIPPFSTSVTATTGYRSNSRSNLSLPLAAMVAMAILPPTTRRED